jgi:hypothetical protein
MATKSVQTLLEDICFVSEERHAIAQAVRTLVKTRFKDTSEEVKYGGILFTAQVQFCGVFVYKEHVSVEFGHGAKIKDPFGHLEGSGKGRRHVKLKTVADIEDKELAQYLLLAWQAASAS